MQNLPSNNEEWRVRCYDTHREVRHKPRRRMAVWICDKDLK
jgi:hypothetical protein